MDEKEGEKQFFLSILAIFVAVLMGGWIAAWGQVHQIVEAFIDK